MRIRPFTPSDAVDLANIFHASVREVGLRDYSVEQVMAWSPAAPDPQRYIRQAEGRTFLVAEDDGGRPIGYADLEPNGHIDHLYCSPEYVGQGVGSALYLALEEAANNAAIAMLFVEASEAARRLFERHGFAVIVRNDFEINGVAIHNYRMSKTLYQPS